MFSAIEMHGQLETEIASTGAAGPISVSFQVAINPSNAKHLTGGATIQVPAFATAARRAAGDLLGPSDYHRLQSANFSGYGGQLCYRLAPV